MGIDKWMPIGIPFATMTPIDAITVLLSRGMTESAIGAAVGAAQSTINKIKRGEMVPNWETGKALIDLASQPPEEQAA